MFILSPLKKFPFHIMCMYGSAISSLRNIGETPLQLSSWSRSAFSLYLIYYWKTLSSEYALYLGDKKNSHVGYAWRMAGLWHNWIELVKRYVPMRCSDAKSMSSSGIPHLNYSKFQDSTPCWLYDQVARKRLGDFTCWCTCIDFFLSWLLFAVTRYMFIMAVKIVP